MDAKLRKLMGKYGLQGYGLYWYCLELIAVNVDAHRLNFDLDHDAELISRFVGIHQDLVQEMMQFMVELNLFENRDGIITCLKMSIRSDEYTQKLLRQARSIGTQSGQTPDNIPTLSGQTPTKSALLEQIRTDKNNIRSSVPDDHSFNHFWEAYPRKVAKKKAEQIWKTKKLSKHSEKILDHLRTQNNCDEWRDKKYIPHPTTYLNGERWNDEPIKAETENPFEGAL